MNILRTDLNRFATVREQMRDVEVMPGTMTNVICGDHPELGETILVQDGDAAFIIADGLRFLDS